MASGSASGAGSSPLGPATAAAAAAAATRAAIHIPPNPPRCSSSSNPVPPTLAAFSDFSDFARQLQAKQQHSNYHSSSLSTSLKDMVAASVNRTSLHPSGVQYVFSSVLPGELELVIIKILSLYLSIYLYIHTYIM